MTDGMLERSKEMAKFYYSAQQYFRSLMLICETVSNYLTDKGYTILSWYSGKPLNMESYNYASNRGACLPKKYIVLFRPKEKPLETYAFIIWFFSEDPDSLTPWLPFGFICRAIRKEVGDWQHWVSIPRIAEYIRPLIIDPIPESAYSKFSKEWPEKLVGQGIDELTSLEVVPFLLAAIKDSHDLEDLIKPVIEKLEQGTGNTIKDDNNYVNTFLGITAVVK